MYRHFFKRAFDIVIALLLCFMTLWIWIPVMLLYAMTGQGPVFFLQERTGKNEKVFKIIKFRTLDTTETKPLQERRFWLGDFLRATSLDELPQLVNVLKGEMSMVGPRPLPVAYLSLLSISQQTRHSVFPGVTGWTQVNGRHALGWQKKFELDLYYVSHLSAGLDLWILVKTVFVLLSFKKDISLDERPFEGN